MFLHAIGKGFAINHNMLTSLTSTERSTIDLLSREILNAAMRVHTVLGPGLLESAYEACLAHELQSNGISTQAQVSLPVTYRGVQLNPGYRIDLLIEQLIVVEIKAVNQLLPIHKAQLLSYLRLGGYRLGLLINFKEVSLKDGIRRVVNHL